MKNFIIICAAVFIFQIVRPRTLNKQELVFTKQDSLSSITKERWDVKYYHLDVKVNPTAP
jgi:hypothetical protein